MAKKRRYSRQTTGVPVQIQAFLVLAVLAGIQFAIEFIQENALWFILLGIILLIGLFILLLLSVRRKKKEKAQYESTPFYIETSIPQARLKQERGLAFEAEIFNQLKLHFKDDIEVIHHLFIPKVNALNEYSEIDLVAIHSSGIYVIEAKNFSGPVTGKDEDDQWHPYLKDEDDENANYRKNYAIKSFYNPIKQNEGHINSLNALLPFQYVNLVIFSNSMLLNSAEHTRIKSIKKAIDFIENNPLKSVITESLLSIKNKLLSFHVRDPKAYKLHIARIKSLKSIE
jgi:hypothetical protein